jgi:hypothetical protein
MYLNLVITFKKISSILWPFQKASTLIMPLIVFQEGENYEVSNVAVFLNFGAKINENFTVHKHFGENYGVISFTSWAIFQRPKEKQFVLLMYID